MFFHSGFFVFVVRVWKRSLDFLSLPTLSLSLSSREIPSHLEKHDRVVEERDLGCKEGKEFFFEFRVFFFKKEGPSSGQPERSRSKKEGGKPSFRSRPFPFASSFFSYRPLAR